MAGPGVLSFSRTEKYCTKLADEVMKLRGEKSLFDFKIHVKDNEFPCAKFVMAAHSPMLRAMLTSDMAEVAKQEIRLDHISKDIIQIILDYMYCEHVSFHKDQLMDLIAAADYLQMTELKQMGLHEVPDILELDNVISWWKETTKMNYDSIKEQCEELMAGNFGQISHQTGFLNLDLDEMQHYVSDICRDTVNSDDTIDALMRWVSHNEERIPYLEDLLNKVKLSKCSAVGIKAIMKTHEPLLDKAHTVYKLLLNTVVDIATVTPKESLDMTPAQTSTTNQQKSTTMTSVSCQVNWTGERTGHSVPLPTSSSSTSPSSSSQQQTLCSGKSRKSIVAAAAAIHSAPPPVSVAWTTLASPTASSSTSGTSKHHRSHRTSALTSSMSTAPLATSSYKLRSSYCADTLTEPISATANTTDDMPTDDTCSICMCPFTNPKTLEKCKHKFCEECIDASFKKTKPACPVCGEIYGEIKGNQPKGGTMKTYTEYHSRLPGYEGCGTIVIDYHIPGGTQGPSHPNPGAQYRGARRTAYLPDNTEGRKVLRLLERAFNNHLMFTIGRSVTSGQDNIVTWNDIHHKTNRFGGPDSYGYPDPTYLQRVQDELAAKGIK